MAEPGKSLTEVITEGINEKLENMLKSLAAATGAPKTKILEEIQKYAAANKETWKEKKVYVGVVGDPGAGKSTFINSIRGLAPQAPGAAEVGLGHTTTVVEEYPHPARPDNLIFVDFPGVLLKKGTGKERDFDIQQYLDEHGANMKQCDVFLVFSSGRIQHNAVQIGMKARDMQKKVLFVRSKFDIDLADKRNDDPKYFEGKTQPQAEADLMGELRQDYIKVLKQVGWEGDVNPKDVFIISGRLKNVLEGSWDIPEFRKAMIEGLGTLQKMVVINTCRDFSKETTKERGDVYRKFAWYIALGTTAGSFIPVAGLAAFAVTLVPAYYLYKEGFCLTDDSVKQLAEMTNKNPEDLKRTLYTKLLGKAQIEKGEIEAVIVIQIICSGLGIVTGASIFLDHAVDLVFPVIGAAITAPLAYGTTVKVLRALISRMEDCAGQLFDYAFKESVV